MKNTVRIILLFLIFAMPFHLRAQQDTIFRTFSVRQVDNGVLISFTIRGGITCSGVRIERSDNGEEFMEIYEFAGVCGAINTDESYSFTDTNPLLNATAWYRLDLGSLGLYSGLVDVRYINYNDNGITIFPNPCSDDCMLYFSNKTFQEHELHIYNDEGKLILSEKIKGEFASFSKYGLTPGIYFLRLFKNEEERHSSKVLIY